MIDHFCINEWILLNFSQVISLQWLLTSRILVSPTRGKQRIFRKSTEIDLGIQKTENSLVDGIPAENAGIQPQRMEKYKTRTACQFGRKAKKWWTALRNFRKILRLRKSLIISDKVGDTWIGHKDFSCVQTGAKSFSGDTRIFIVWAHSQPRLHVGQQFQYILLPT